MELLVICVFLAILAALFSVQLQARLRRWFHSKPARIFLAPSALTLFVGAALLVRDGLQAPFAIAFALYTFFPTLLVYLSGRTARARALFDFAAILLLWLPVEFTVGRTLLPEHAHSLAINAAKGTAVALALFVFVVYRDLKGVKYNLPRRGADVAIPALGFLAAAPVLIYLGLRLSFLGPFRIPENLSAAGFARLFAVTLAGVAIPEELLFRSLIQNRLMQHFGESNRTLLLAAVIFGAAHLNNAPGPLPNWRYMLLATIAGLIYGKVFQKSSTVLSSAALHACINSVRHTFFG